MDTELEQWSELEYNTIAGECAASGSEFWLTSVPASLPLPSSLKEREGESLTVEQHGVEEIFVHSKAEVCLLDPAASSELSPDDGDRFRVFLFGGILGK